MPKPVAARVPVDERVALYPDLPFEGAVAALLAVDPRKDTEEATSDGDPS